ncbi:3-ketoacyl-CoA thiolase @ Acetyl-CoA acetyltransferase [Leuconostoc gelidum subsp. gasicomitatum]|uniref:3-ketoacyl-CoA thiolase @ Acetyl-CoA acetyltransferase n=1 Tax=Leuconostoc gasicomitatum TaxID=115778 RepID=A0ABM9V803_9LACO|nr:3-ketoacyl-CoA thiolase @ Acetyl-CoA acetyltransferase [Leuconostoc gasicomitatum]SOC30463.1 hypothetical protein LGAA44_50059 [Leuconostoc gasicomitatum]
MALAHGTVGLASDHLLGPINAILCVAGGMGMSMLIGNQHWT